MDNQNTIPDLWFDFGTFANTQATVTPQSEVGRLFVSQFCKIEADPNQEVTLPKQKVRELLEKAKAEGLDTHIATS